MNGYRLREIKIELNRACPLRCLHCSSNGLLNAPEKLNPKKVSDLIFEFAQMGGNKVCISGGEPLYYPELHLIIDACHEARVNISLYTTGIVPNGGYPTLSDKMADYLAEKEVRTVFSIHGAHCSTHEALTRVAGSFDATLKAIERVKKAGVVAEAHVVPTTLNLHELVDITKLARSLHLNKISWLRFVPQGRGFVNRRILELGKEELWNLPSLISRAHEVCPEVTIRTGAPFNILCPEQPASCEAALSVLTINPDGVVSPCDAFKRLRLPDEFGSIKNHSLAEVWQKSFFLNAIRNLSESKLKSRCASCSLYSRCNSGCLAQKLIAAGTLIDGRDPDCPLDSVEVVRDGRQKVAVC